MNIKELIDKRLQRVELMIKATAAKIVKKEMKKLQKEIVKEMLKNG